MLGRLNSILNWSVRVGSLFGIPISLHITVIFFLFPAFSGRSLGVWYSLEWGALIILSILLHELGHALTAKRYKLTDLSIMLHGFGGFAVSSGSRTPHQSLMITLAGPAVTFAIGFICLGISYLAKDANLGTDATLQLYIVESMGKLNILLGVLNMIPSLPFDGGNALSAILSRKLSEFKANRVVGHIGLFFTPVLALYGLLTSNSFVTIFGIMGFVTSLGTLLQTGGVKPREALDDRRDRKELEVVKQRQQARTQAYLGDVRDRERERQEQERLRRILEGPPND